MGNEVPLPSLPPSLPPFSHRFLGAMRYFYSPFPPSLPPSLPPSGIIREEGGKLHMLQRQWSEAYSEFNEGFRAYQVGREGGREGGRAGGVMAMCCSGSGRRPTRSSSMSAFVVGREGGREGGR
jgi:hypothetical protein